MLRVYSPSAEVQGHSPDQAVLQIGKENVNIIEISPVGNYAIKIKFSDGHDTGLFSWSYLHHLAKNYEQLWLEYIGKLDAQGIQRKIESKKLLILDMKLHKERKSKKVTAVFTL